MGIHLKDLTNGSTKREAGTQPVWEGTAIFDVLMKAVNENINIQYELTRITGSDYATVYLGAIETCIKESTNLLLQKAIADKEIEVKQAQILNIQEDTRLKTAQANAFPLQAVQELALTTEQVLTQKEDTKLKAAQAIAYPLQSKKDLEVKTQQIISMQMDDDIKITQSAKDLEVKTKEIEVKSAQVETMKSDMLIKAAQSTKDLEVKTKEIAVKDQQILTMKNDDSIKAAQSIKDLDVKSKEIAFKTAQISTMDSDNLIKKEQSTKDLGVKQAQIDKLIDDLLTAAKQRELYSRQILGFDDNKYQKLFESQLSSWGLMFSSGMMTEKPAVIRDDKVSTLYSKLTTGV